MEEQTLTYSAEQAFLQAISLYRYLGNKDAVNKAKTIVAEYLHLKADNKGKILPPTIALLGTKGSGRRAMAYAISNAFGNQSLCQLDADFIDSNRLENALKFDTILVRNIDSIGHFISEPIYELINSRKLQIRYMNTMDRRILYYDGLIIVTSDIFPKGAKSLIEATDTKIYLMEKYSKNEIYNILEQRIACFDWVTNSRDVLTNIVEKANSVSEAVDMLTWSKRCAIAGNASEIAMKHLDEAIRMIQLTNFIPAKKTKSEG